MHKSVLIVDDEQLLARTLSTVLREAGYKTVVAGSAEEAERRLGEAPVDLIVIDNRLPRESGIQMVRRLREQERESKVILMTAYETPEVKAEARRLKVDRYLKKPFDLAALVDEVKSLIGPGGNSTPD